MIDLTKPLNKFNIQRQFMDISNLSGAYFNSDIDNINPDDIAAISVAGIVTGRSEERRVGKEC